MKKTKDINNLLQEVAEKILMLNKDLKDIKDFFMENNNKDISKLFEGMLINNQKNIELYEMFLNYLEIAFKEKELKLNILKDDLNLINELTSEKKS